MGAEEGQQVSEDEIEYGLVMPFVVCASQGGPYDDDSFVAGWRLGQLDSALADGNTDGQVFVQPGDVPQVDLIAMKHGHTASWDYGASGGWVGVSFARGDAND